MGDDLDWKALSSPPRALPMHVRARLIVNPVTVIGGVILAFGMALTVRMVFAHGMIGARRLDRVSAEIAGRLDGYENVDNQPGNSEYSPIHRFRYCYRTPDGFDRTGESFLNVRDQPRGELPPCGSLGMRPDDPDRRPIVSVQYSPDHPETSRIKGLRTGWYEAASAKGILGFLGVVGGLMLIGGVETGLRCIHLLAVGLPAQARILSIDQGEDSPKVSFEEYRDKWLNRKPPDPIGEQGLRTRRAWLARANVSLALVAGVFVARVVTVASWGRNPLADLPSWLLGVAIAIFYLLRKVARAELRAAKDPASKAARWASCMVRCAYKFTTHEGRTILGTASFLFDSRKIAEGSLPILYDPARPKKLRCLDRLTSSLRLSDSHVWEIDGPAHLPWLDAAFLVAVVVTSPLLGWVAWRLLG